MTSVGPEPSAPLPPSTNDADQSSSPGASNNPAPPSEVTSNPAAPPGVMNNQSYPPDAPNNDRPQVVDPSYPDPLPCDTNDQMQQTSQPGVTNKTGPPPDVSYPQPATSGVQVQQLQQTPQYTYPQPMGQHPYMDYMHRQPTQVVIIQQPNNQSRRSSSDISDEECCAVAACATACTIFLCCLQIFS